MIFNKTHLYFYCIIPFCLSIITFAYSSELEKQFPAPNPPFVENTDTISTSITMALTNPDAPDTEWTFHKTLDGSHPNGHEQQILWLMNRARANPTQEGLWLASSTDQDVAGGRSYFGVDLDKLESEFAAFNTKPPAAFDNRLYAAAFVHSTDLISRDAQDHNQQFDRIADAGFHLWSARISVFSYASSGLNAHAAFNIDWGPDDPDDGDGMQAGRGHRMAIMSGDGEYTNVGIAAVHETDDETDVGEYVTSGNYCQANTDFANHFNKFIVGTVWDDVNDNGQYDPGEGIANVTVKPDQGTFYAETGDSGGYAIPVTDNGTYKVTFTGTGLPGTYIKSAIVSGQSVLMDIETGSDLPIKQQQFPLPAILLLLE